MKTANLETVDFVVTRVIVPSEKSFEQVAEKIHAVTGRIDNAVFEQLVKSKQSFEQVKNAVESMTGKSGFMIFSQIEHGKLLSLGGKYRSARLYIIGNPLIAKQMFEQDSGIGMYVPLRLFVYENPDGKTHVAYDKPSSLLNQFHNENISAIAQMLDQKLEEMTAMVTQ